MSVRVFAPAKINLTLQVARPRADGMHELQSAVMFADVGDWVEASDSEGVSLRVDGPFAQAFDDGNLVEKAANAFARAAAVTRGAALRLEKNLPVASGIGGGSSDAAAALKALDALWTLQRGEAELMRIGATLGADVPVCVAGRSAWMTGVGDIIEPLETPPLDAVLINPGRPLPTAAVFREFDRMGLGGSFSTSPAPRWRTVSEAVAGAAALGNDLVAPARAIMPEIGDIAALLRADARVLHAGLSGSGATLYALTADEGASLSLARDLATRSRDWWVRPTRLGAA